MHNDGAGTAFEMHGDIFAFYKSWAGKDKLGHLVSDEGNTTYAGGRKNLFSSGGIYWLPATGAEPVTRQMYLDYEHIGEFSFTGFPTNLATNITGGLEQQFQGGRMHYKTGDHNAEVHGLILDKFLATGGVNTCGYPITNESDVMKNGISIGRFSAVICIAQNYDFSGRRTASCRSPGIAAPNPGESLYATRIFRTRSRCSRSIRGVRNGTFAYAAKHMLSEFRVQSDIQVSERHSMHVDDLGTSKSAIRLGSSRSKLTTVQVANKLCVERDEVKLTIEGVPVDAGKELVLNLKPGLGGMELLASN